MQLDGLKTCFIEGIPALPREDINKALSSIGPQTIFTVKDDRNPEKHSLFCQFRSAAQIKVALEILPQIQTSNSNDRVSVTVSQETQDWIEGSARTASVVSVTRMQAPALMAKIQSQLDAAIRSRTQNIEEKTDLLEPDGTLTSEFTPDELETLRKEVLEFRKETVRLQKEQESRRTELINQFRNKFKNEDKASVPPEDKEFAEFDERQVLSQSSPVPELSWEQFVANVKQKIDIIAQKQQAFKEQESRRIEYAEQELARLKSCKEVSFPGDIRSLQIKCAKERELDEQDAQREAQEGPYEEIEVVDEPEPTDIDWAKVTDEWIESTLKPEISKQVAEIFGEVDESLVDFVVDLVKAKTPAADLPAELEAPLDEDAAQFSQMLIKLLKSA